MTLSSVFSGQTAAREMVAKPNTRPAHFRNGIGICIIRDFNINDRLAHGDLTVGNVRHAALEVFQQTILKGFAVQSLEDDLTALEQ